MPWEQKAIPSPLIDGMKDIASALAAPGQAVETILGTTADAIDIAKLFVTAQVDPLSALFLAVLDEIDELVNDTFGAGIYQLYVNPFEVQSLGVEEIKTKFSTGISLDPTADEIKFIVQEKSSEYQFDNFGIPLMTPGTAINHMIRSFDDEGDLKRPIFSPSAEVCAYGIIVTAPSLAGFTPILEGLLAILDLKPFARLLNNLLKKSVSAEFFIPRFSRKPDWNNTLSLSSIPILREQRDVLIDALNTVRGYVNNADTAISDLLSIIQRKIDALLDVVKAFNELIAKIQSAVAASGAYIFDFPPQIGGVEAIKSALRDPALAKLSQNGYSAGCLFVGGGPSMIPVNTIRELLT